MADKKKKATENRSVPPAIVTEKAAPMFTVARLRKDCLELFGVGITTYDGATYGLEGQYTVNEMREIINNWKEQEVK